MRARRDNAHKREVLLGMAQIGAAPWRAPLSRSLRGYSRVIGPNALVRHDNTSTWISRRKRACRY